MKTGAVAASVGQFVRAGQQIGLAASSGCSTGPHLHFESQINGTPYEPFAGACNPGQGGWVQPEPFEENLRVLDFAFSRVGLSNADPVNLPTSAQKALADSHVYFWIKLANLAPGSTWQVVFYRPDGSTGFTSGIATFPEGGRWSWWWWDYIYPEMQIIPGNWRLILKINGAVAIDSNVEVVASIDPQFNRIPNPIAVSLHPASPTIGDPIRCDVSGPFPIADPDFQLVRHRYRWTVGSTVLRDVTTASRSDVLPRSSVGMNKTVTCSVTPTDGQLWGATQVVSVTVGAGCAPDLNGSGEVDGSDIGVFLTQWGPQSAATTADFNADGLVDGSDLGTLITFWGACPD
jgi:hypothetical protein